MIQFNVDVSIELIIICDRRSQESGEKNMPRRREGTKKMMIKHL